MRPDIDLCLSPQVFHNVDLDNDVFNNMNLHFWEIWCASGRPAGPAAHVPLPP